MRHGWLLLLTVFAATLLGCDARKKTDSKPESPATNTGMFEPSQVALSEVEESQLKALDQPLIFTQADGTIWTAPIGTLTDGASIPEAALPLIGDRFDPRYLNAAIVHDAYSQTDNAAVTVEQYRRRSWQSTHRMFYEACLVGGTPKALAKTMYAAVLIGGPRWEIDSAEPSQDTNTPLGDAEIMDMTHLCETYIKETDPTLEEIEAWVEDHRQQP